MCACTMRFKHLSTVIERVAILDASRAANLASLGPARSDDQGRARQKTAVIRRSLTDDWGEFASALETAATCVQKPLWRCAPV